MITDRTMKVQVSKTLGAEGFRFDLVAIVDEIKKKFGLIDIGDVPNEKYWAIVEKHQVA